ncbi:pyrroline-5-carboxylate reductase [Niallia sp. 01092]|uniref:pyrroline-5-carboxylate reductase n=1 Tax=unclassified Niallia TaxID=2837522 RepID=UPI003FD2E2FE
MSTIHFIGGGQMAEAIIRALLTNNVYINDQISVFDVNDSRCELLQKKYQIVTTSSPIEKLASADLIVIAVRPQDDLETICQNIKEESSSDAVIISIVAGVTIKKLTSYLGENRSIIRVIPNTLTDTGLGYSGVALNKYATKEQAASFLTGFGKVEYIDESLIDIFTGYGVAGPNYVYYFIESLADAGVLAGLPREQAWKIALENTAGAVAMLQKTQLHPRQLLDINNSPAGVGIHALYELNNSDFAAGLQRSVLKAVQRTTELGDE